MDKTERFNEAYSYLKWKKIIKTQSDLAQIIGCSRANVSAALNGNPSVLTNSFLNRFISKFSSVFNYDWLINGNGEMLLKGQEAPPITQELKNMPPWADALIHLVVENTKAIERLLEENKELRASLSQAINALNQNKSTTQEPSVMMVAENHPQQ